MPELPDVVIYIEALEKRITGATLDAIRITNPFVLRTVQPSPEDLAGRKVVTLRRMGKRIVIALERDAFIVIHLMLAGRFRWAGADEQPVKKVPPKLQLARLAFSTGTLTFTEAGSKRRASIHLVEGEDALNQFDRGGIEVLEATLDQFAEALVRENHTLKRALTDPRLFSGIGNAYSDEILHRARLSPLQLTGRMDAEQVDQLFVAVKETLRFWIETTRAETGNGFPEKVTAFRRTMAVHGKYGRPCPVCGAPVQRIVYADNETNYCAKCQTGGRLLADRALSRLLRTDWPRSLDEIE
ncbi:MAG TPA: DNA-formamidopyrimidine glycosylase family protein [Thermoanaerobaculia bacterium]|nr:DNA-formamidopyrimidine glycosylase family protein [Thermoanaerobaculia bacterium]